MEKIAVGGQQPGYKIHGTNGILIPTLNYVLYIGSTRIYPSSSNSHHQDHDILSRESLQLFATVPGWPVVPNHMNNYSLKRAVDGSEILHLGGAHHLGWC